MNPCLASAAVLAAALSGSASAQSGVTIAGLVDIGVTHNDNRGAAHWKVARGNNNRLVFRAAEDLGDGMSATVALQHRFEPDTGTAESTVRPFWQGESRVGLRSRGLGWLRLGRGLTPVQDPNGRLEVFGVATVANTQDWITAFYKSVDDIGKPLGAAGVSPAFAGGEARWDNAVFYDTPDLDGLAGRLAMQAEHSELARPFGASLAYEKGPLFAMLGGERNNRGTRFFQAGGSWAFAHARLVVSYALHDPPGTLRITAWGVGPQVPLGGALTLRAAHARAHSNGPGAVTARKSGAGLLYAFSRRTSVYTDVARSNPLTGSTPLNEFDLGIAHSF